MRCTRPGLACVALFTLLGCDSANVAGCIGPLCFVGSNGSDCAENGRCLCPTAASLDTELASALTTLRATSRTCGSVSHAPAASMAWDSTLDTAATDHAADMYRFGFTDPLGSDGLSVTDRLAQDAEPDFRYDTTLEQLVSDSSASLNGVLNTWLDTPAACTALMSTDLSHAGIACAGNTTVAARDINRWSLVLGGE